MDLVHIFTDFFRFLQMVSGKFCVTEDRIHRCPDIMRHIEQEGRFRLVGCLCCFCGLFQKLLLGEFSGLLFFCIKIGNNN